MEGPGPAAGGEHFLKVVQSVHEYVGGQVRETYEYTVNSNLYQTPPEGVAPSRPPPPATAPGGAVGGEWKMWVQ